MTTITVQDSGGTIVPQISQTTVSTGGIPGADSVAAAVTVSTAQTITGEKHFSGDVAFGSGRPWLDVTHPAFGAAGDGVTDDTAAIQAALDAAAAGPVYLPAGTFLISSALTVPSGRRNGCHLLGAGATLTQIKATHAGAALLLDPSDTPGSSTRRQYWRIEHLFLNGPGSGTADSIGIHANNALMGYLAHVVVQGFETGVKFDGLSLANDAACYYNSGIGLLVSSCGIAIHFAGQANSNTLTGGKASGSTTGVLIDAATTNNTLVGVDIESNTGTAAVVIDGSGNHLVGCRLENPDATYDLHFNAAGGTGASDGANNTVLCYWSATDIDARIHDQSVNLDNLILWPGRIITGSPNSSRKEIIRGYRYSDANLMPAVDIQDRYTSGGSPIGYRHVQSRLGSIAFEASRTVSPFSTLRTYFRVMTEFATGKAQLWWGDYNVDAVDTNLYRDAANVLKTDDQLRAADGIVTKAKAGAISDADFAVAPPDGAMAVDTSTNTLYVRSGGAWHTTPLT